MKVAVYTRSFLSNGAGSAAARLIRAIDEHSDGAVSFELYSSDVEGRDVLARHSDDQNARQFSLRLAAKATRIPLRLVSGFGPRAPFDYGLVPSGMGKELAESQADIIHLHWLGDGDFSLAEIEALPRPVVWTMHDMWAFLGAERFTLGDSYTNGYQERNGMPVGRQLVNRFILSRKKRLWKSPISLVAPSTWLAERARRSPITQDWPIHVIPNALDTNFWTPGDQNESRKRLGLPPDKWLVLFGAVDPLGNHNKGADLLADALKRFRANLPKHDADRVHLAVFGSKGESRGFSDFGGSFLGSLEPGQMRDAYQSANVVVVPSRLENLPQVATEAGSCGIPVIAFNTTGVPDAVVHDQTGLLADAYDTKHMARCLESLFCDEPTASRMGQAARRRAVAEWSNQVVADKYLRLFEFLMSSQS